MRLAHVMLCLVQCVCELLAVCISYVGCAFWVTLRKVSTSTLGPSKVLCIFNLGATTRDRAAADVTPNLVLCHASEWGVPHENSAGEILYKKHMYVAL